MLEKLLDRKKHPCSELVKIMVDLMPPSYAVFRYSAINGHKPRKMSPKPLSEQVAIGGRRAAVQAMRMRYIDIIDDRTGELKSTVRVSDLDHLSLRLKEEVSVEEVRQVIRYKSEGPIAAIGNFWRAVQQTTDEQALNPGEGDRAGTKGAVISRRLLERYTAPDGSPATPVLEWLGGRPAKAGLCVYYNDGGVTIYVSWPVMEVVTYPDLPTLFRRDREHPGSSTWQIAYPPKSRRKTNRSSPSKSKE